jgi:DNA invertase Pin-like site-specific DNA recombinase
MKGEPQEWVALYLRVSEDKNDKSLDDQEREGRADCAARGWKVRRVYRDFDRPASDPHSARNREGFNAMRADVTARADFSRVWVWACDRLARLEAMYFWPEVLPFVEGGVRLTSGTEGDIPWSTEEERLMLSFRLLSAHGKAKTTSADATRGLLSLVERGGWPGAAPYGYRLHHPDDVPKLAPGKRAAVVLQTFERCDSGEWSVRALAADLNARKVRPPRGPERPADGKKKARSGLWSWRTVAQMLRNEVYLGHTIYNRTSRAKHTAIAGGRPKPLSPQDKKARRDRHEARPRKRNADAAVRLDNPPGEVIRKENTHPPIVPPDLFARVQARLAERRHCTQTKGAREYALAGLLRCSCGAAMRGKVSHFKGGEPVLCYTCAGWTLYGPAACPRHRKAYESHVLNMAGDLIFLELVGPGGDEWERKLRERLQAANHDAPEEARRLRADIATLEGNVAKARRNLALLEPDMIPDVTKQIRQWEARLAVLKPRLAEVSKTAERVADVEARVAEARRKMMSIGHAFLHDGDREEKRLADRRVLREEVERVECVWGEEEVSGRVRSRLAGVRITFRPDSLLGPDVATVWPPEEPELAGVGVSFNPARGTMGP